MGIPEGEEKGTRSKAIIAEKITELSQKNGHPDTWGSKAPKYVELKKATLKLIIIKLL